MTGLSSNMTLKIQKTRIIIIKKKKNTKKKIQTNKQTKNSTDGN
jgi:hypothetical protein